MLIISRVVFSTFLLGTLAFFQQKYRIYSFQTSSLYYFIVVIYALSGLYWHLQRIFRNITLFAFLQIGGDIVLVTFLVHLTGGIDSGFSLLYHLTIISGAIILYRRGGYLAASLSSILYGGMLDLQYYNALGFVRSQGFTAVQVMYQVFINILSFYVVAFLSGYLSERLRRTRQELQEKSIDFNDLRALQEHILRSVGSGILTMDLEGNITSWNPGAEQITGYNYAEIRGKWQDVFGSSIRGIFGHTEDIKERPFHFNGEITKKDGAKAVLGMIATLLRDDREAVRGIIFIFQDITKIIEMEEQVRRQERLASVGGLAAGIAHEIRNPLASLSGSIQVLKNELELKGDNRNLMNIVLQETERLNAIITEFLEYARPKTRQHEHIPLTPLVEETIVLLKNSRDFRDGITFNCEIDKDAAVTGDPQRMRQVFWNLLINSCQAIPERGRISIRIRHVNKYDHDNAEWMDIDISDTGLGIAPEHRKNIFLPFFTTKPGGTGLGLAIVYRIIEDHGGTINVISEPERGTSFRIMLPASEKHVLTR